MKKLILSAAMIAGLGVFAANQAMAADGTITFNGNISAVTCSVHGGTPGNNSGDFTVTLPTVAASAFTSSPAAGATPYNIYVGAAGETGCTDGTSVSVYYEPTSPQIASNGNLDLDASSTATGVQIQVLDGDSKQAIDLRNTPASAPVIVAGNQATLPFYAQYFANGTAINAGTANSSVLYSIKYN